MAIRALPLCATASLLLVLVGCQPAAPDADFRNYLTRLGNTLDREAQIPASASTPRPPRSGQLRIDFPPDTLGALDFLELRGCELQLTIGKRNSSLGRMARDSQRLLLELEFLRLAPDCIKKLRGDGDHELALTLKQARENKRRQLPGRIFNATLAAQEYRDFWQPGHQNDYPEHTSSAVISALDSINKLVSQWLQGDYRADNLAFELLLSEVGRGDGGLLWQALSEQSAWLSSADALLLKQANTAPLCSTGHRADAADILPNVVKHYFVGDIQPRAAQLGRRYHSLLPPVRKLEQLLADSTPPLYDRWKVLREASLDHAALAPRRHVAQIQVLLAPCSEPGR